MGHFPNGATSSGVTAAAWQFLPETYGAVGDFKIVSDAAITATQHQLTSATAAFTSADVGKTVYVVGAGAAGADLFTTIATFTNATTVQLTATAGTTVSGKGMAWHTDDTAAIKLALSAAVTFALADPSRRAQIVLSKIYGVSTAPVIGGSTLGNAVIPLPIVTATTTPKIRIEWVGQYGTDAAELAHWLQPAPQVSGPGLACVRLDGTNDASNGPAVILGGPVNGYGANASLFSNMAIVLDSIRFIVPFNSTYGGADFLGLAEDYEHGVGVQPLGIVPAAGAWPQFNQASITNQFSWGIRKGDANNNDRQDINQYSCEGMTYGFGASEHTTWDSARAIYCILGCEIFAGASMPHGIRGNHLSAESCAWGVGVYNALPFGNTVKAVVTQVDLESSGLLFDNNNLMSGSLGVMANNTPGYAVYTISGGHLVTQRELMAPPGPIASPQAPPANNTAWVNSYNCDVWVTLTATTITQVTITSPGGTAVNQGGLAGSPAHFEMIVPNGCSYTPTFTGSLAHTVTRFGLH